MNISLKQGSVIIDDQGFITRWRANELVSPSSPVYLVLFKDYTRLNPSCRPLDISQPIEIIEWNQDSLIYAKEIESYRFVHTIHVFEEGIDWNIKADPLCISHSFGLALPFYRSWFDSSENPIKEDVAAYANFLHEAFYRDQRILDMPLIYSKKLCVFLSIENDCQFFRYEDNNNEWLRIISFTKITDTIEICFRTSQEPLASYIEKFPHSDKFINKWKTKLELLGDLYSVQIMYQKSDRDLRRGFISRSAVLDKDLQAFYILLESEFKKYPLSIFEKLDIRYIILVSDLYLKNNTFKKIDGAILWGNENETDKGLMFDIKAGAQLIHHEIFHIIEKHCDFSDIPGQINQISIFCQIDNMNEYMAELFATLMVNPGKVYKFEGVAGQLEYLCNQISSIMTIPSPISPSIEDRTIYVLKEKGREEIRFGSISSGAIRYGYNYQEYLKCH